MKALLVYTNQKRELSPPPLGMSMVAEDAERTGHRVATLDLMFVEDANAALKDALARHRPDMVGFSLRNLDNQDMSSSEAYSPRYKEWVSLAVKEAPVVLGGSAFSTYPDEMLAYTGATVGIAGQADRSFGAFLTEWEQKGADGPFTTPGVVWRQGSEIKQNPITLDGYVRPDTGQVCWRHIEFAKYRKVKQSYFSQAVITKAGCPYRCFFCDTHVTFGKEFMLRPIEAIVDELERNRREYGMRHDMFMFVDALFNEPIDFAKQLLEALIRTGRKHGFLVVFEPTVFDEELIRLLKRAGCVCTTMLAGGATDELLQAHCKTFTVQDLHRASSLLEKHHIPYVMQFLVGAPGETMESVEAALSFGSSRRPFVLQVGCGVRINKQTPAHARALEEGMITPDESLLLPRFYVSPTLPKDRVKERLGAFNKANGPRYRDLMTLIWKMMTLRFA
jgi:radical SAM superfamily enzyme YgiQ (UPF0313 family)